MSDPQNPTRASPPVDVTCDHDPAAPSLSHSTDRYLLGEEIARGGMGDVLRAEDEVVVQAGE